VHRQTSSHRGKAEVGYYEPIEARKYFDGKLHTTFLLVEDYDAAMEQRRKESKTLELKQASDFFNDLGGSPTGSKEAEYANLQKGPDAMTSSNREHPLDVKPRAADLSGPSSLKEPPYYDQRRSIKPLSSTPGSLENPEPGIDGALTGSPALKNLQGQGASRVTRYLPFRSQ
jgi:hypothetical protein